MRSWAISPRVRAARVTGTRLIATLASALLALAAVAIASRAQDVGGVLVWGPQSAARAGLRVGQVIEVTPDGPAGRAGIVAGDTLLAIGGVPLLAPDSLARALALAPADSPCAIVRARSGGPVPDSARGSVVDTLEVSLAPLPPRLGAFVTTGGLTPTGATVVDDSVSVTASLSEWGGLTFVALRVDHRGRGWLAFGPDSVTVLDGTRRVQRPLSPGELRLLGDARFEHGPVAAWVLAPVLRDLAAAERSLDQNRLRPLEIPSGANTVGLMVFAVERMASPVAVTVRCARHEYAFSFARPY